MGFAPPKDGPSTPALPGAPSGLPSGGLSAGVSVGMPAAPTGFFICGFGFPLAFLLTFSLRIPAFPPFPIPPSFNFLLRLTCDLSDPFDASFGFGGGRVVNSDPEADPEFGA
jgi:hypothetical protein